MGEAGGFFFAVVGAVGGDGAVEELVVLHVDLEEGGALHDAAGDEGLGERVFDESL